MNKDFKKIIVIFVVVSMIILLVVLAIEVSTIFNNKKTNNEELNNNQKMDSLKQETNIPEDKNNDELYNLEWVNKSLVTLLLENYDGKHLNGESLKSFVKQYHNSGEIIVIIKNIDKDNSICSTVKKAEISSIGNIATSDNIVINDDIISFDEIEANINNNDMYKSYIIDYNVNVVGIIFVKQ